MSDLKRTTEFGKMLRRLRVDRDEKLLDMADKLGRTASFISAVEFGKKMPPADLVDEVVTLYGISDEAADQLRSAADRSRTAFTLHPTLPEARDMAGALARKIDSLSPEQLNEIQKILKRV